MATVPSQSTIAVADKVSAALWNDDVRDAINYYTSTRPLFYAEQTVSQTLTTNIDTPITFTTEVLDRDGQHSTTTNTSRVVIGNTLGWYRVSGCVVYQANSAATNFRAIISKNGTRVGGSFAGILNASTSAVCGVSTGSVLVQATTSTDYVELIGLMTAASGTLATSGTAGALSSLCVEWVGA